MTEKKDDLQLDLLDQLGLSPFKERFPWLGGDLQTLRDTFVEDKLPPEDGQIIHIPVPKIPGDVLGEGYLIALLDRPPNSKRIKGLVLMLHGLGGSSRRRGLRRMTFNLLEAGFAVLRLNLRGADPGRHLAGGTYSAKCSSDLEPVIQRARELCKELRTQEDIKENSTLPLLGVGISLGGTILLNACLDLKNISLEYQHLLDGLVCISSPLDLDKCSSSIEKPRNSIYQYWLLFRLVRQTLADPFEMNPLERKLLMDKNQFGFRRINSIRQFDSVITAPRWGFSDVDDYYQRASPIHSLLNNCELLPKTFLIQAFNDPWVPADSANTLNEQIRTMKMPSNLRVILTAHGGHNGFHDIGGCWGDDLVRNLLEKIVIK